MKSKLLWELDVSQSFSVKCPIYTLCFKIDYSQLIVACANELFFINPNTGEIVDRKRHHQAPIYCVRCSPDGIFFASSSADGFVVISRCVNNDGITRYGFPVSMKSLSWCPTKQMLISCSPKEFQVWHPDDMRVARYKVDQTILSSSFSPNGSTFLLSYENGDVNIYDSNNIPTVLQTYKFTFPLTSVSYAFFDNIEYIVTTDLERHVSLFRTSDKALVGKNSLTFEALSALLIDGFFLFSGISGRICLMTSNLSFLGEIESKGDFIWDTAISTSGQLAIGRRDGIVELRSVEFGLSFARYRSNIAYRTNGNQITIKNVANSSDENSQSKNLSFLKIVYSIHMNESKILVHFKDSLILFDSKTFEKISEIPGDFEKCEFALSESAIVYSKGKELMFIDSVGAVLYSFTFQSVIRSISSSLDGVIIGCVDGTISIIINKKSHLLVQHDSSVEWIERKENQIAILDKNSRCVIYDSFNSSVLRSIDFSTSFAFNDRVTDLYASSNGSTISVYYKDCQPMNHFVEGNLLAFVENKLIVSNRGAIEVIQATLPYEELIQKKRWDDVCALVVSLESLKSIEKQQAISLNTSNTNLDSDSDIGSDCDYEDYYQDLILDECIKRKSFEIAPLLINRSNKSQSFLFAEILPNSPEAASVYVSSYDEKSGQGDAKMIEESGDSHKALDVYAASGDWDSVLRLASTDSNLARQMADFSFPREYASQEAKILLHYGFSDSAIRVLTNSEDLTNLAKTHVYLGKWIDAISLTRLSPSVSPIVYPKMSQLLFESNLWFEALVCLFVVNDYDIRADTIKKMDNCVTSFNQHKFVTLMNAFNEPEQYWSLLDLSYVYLCLENLMRHSFMLPLSIDDAIDVFFMSHFICARYKVTPIRGVDISDVLVHLLFASSILGLKRWVAFALREVLQLDINENIRRIAQLAALRSKETQPNANFTDLNNVNCRLKCPKCGSGLFSSGKLPLLVCSVCGMKIAFSAFSGRPLPLIYISYNGKKNPVTLIQTEPKGNQEEPELTTEFVSDEFLEKSPPEKFVIQKIKKAAGISPQLWLNPTLSSFHVCNICGALMDEVDYEKSFLENDFCPICKGNESLAEDNQILAALRTFEPDSPILF